ncbi:hypothetical protein SDJN03_21377, partial [Cucurbita argyrosperma subsp. sororia]
MVEALIKAGNGGPALIKQGFKAQVGGKEREKEAIAIAAALSRLQRSYRGQVQPQPQPQPGGDTITNICEVYTCKVIDELRL